LEGGINLFAYVANNPVNWIDPFGLIRRIIRYLPGPDGQQVPIVHDTETGRNTIGFPERQTDRDSINEYLKVLAVHAAGAVIWYIMKGQERLLRTPLIRRIVDPAPAEACPKK
jgi:hypothetical protein